MLLKRNTINAWTKKGLFLPTIPPKVVFYETLSMQYTTSALNAIQFTQYTLAINQCISHSIRLLEMHALLTEKITLLIPL